MERKHPHAGADAAPLVSVPQPRSCRHTAQHRPLIRRQTLNAGGDAVVKDRELEHERVGADAASDAPLECEDSPRDVLRRAARPGVLERHHLRIMDASAREFCELHKQCVVDPAELEVARAHRHRRSRPEAGERVGVRHPGSLPDDAFRS